MNYKGKGKRWIFLWSTLANHLIDVCQCINVPRSVILFLLCLRLNISRSCYRKWTITLPLSTRFLQVLWNHCTLFIHLVISNLFVYWMDNWNHNLVLLLSNQPWIQLYCHHLENFQILDYQIYKSWWCFKILLFHLVHWLQD